MHTEQCACTGSRCTGCITAGASTDKDSYALALFVCAQPKPQLKVMKRKARPPKPIAAVTAVEVSPDLTVLVDVKRRRLVYLICAEDPTNASKVRRSADTLQAFFRLLCSVHQCLVQAANVCFVPLCCARADCQALAAHSSEACMDSQRVKQTARGASQQAYEVGRGILHTHRDTRTHTSVYTQTYTGDSSVLDYRGQTYVVLDKHLMCLKSYIDSG